jgi:Zn ribbon nucleic-acid-binding protein
VDHGLIPVGENSSKDHSSKITRAKWTRDVAQAVECLFCKHEDYSNPSPTTKKKKKLNRVFNTEIIKYIFI